MATGTPDTTGTTDVSDQLRADLRHRTLLLAELGQHLDAELREVLDRAAFLADGSLSPEQTEAAAAIHRTCEELLGDLTNVADCVSLESGAVALAQEQFDLHTALRATVANEAFAAAARDIRLRCYVQRDVPRGVIGDGPRLRQLLAKLLQSVIRNADSSEVSVYVSLEAMRADSGVIRVMVCDHSSVGPGLQDDLFRLLDREPRPAPDGQPWTSFRLSVFRDLLRLMGGRFGVAGDEEHGRAFWFTVALQVVEQQRDHLVIAPHHPILLISSCPERVTLVMIALQRRGFVVELEQDLRMFPARVRRSVYSLVLMDRQQGAHVATFAARSAVGDVRMVPVVGIPLVGTNPDRVDEEALLRLVHRWAQPTGRN